MEWTTVTVIIALVGLGAAVIKPIVSLTQSITKLTVVVERLERELDEQSEHSRESHKRLWDHNEEQDNRLDDHERRIHDMEHKA
jgi:hypothetical protein